MSSLSIGFAFVALALVFASHATDATALPARTYVPTLHAGDAVPDLPLVDQRGRRLSLRGGGTTIVSFAYTRCPDDRTCSLVTHKFARLQTLLRDTTVKLVEITLDPTHDRPDVLHRYAASAGADPAIWRFATGRPSDVVALAERFDIDGADVAHGTGAHTESLAFVSADGTLLDLVDGDTWSPGDVAAQARASVGLPSNPLARFALAVSTSVGAACGTRGPGGISIIGGAAIFSAAAVAFGACASRLFGSAR